MQGLARQVIIQVSCGTNHTLCLTEHGQALSFGYDDKGCLGLGAANQVDVLEPRLIDFLQYIPLRKVVAAETQSFAVTGVCVCVCVCVHADATQLCVLVALVCVCV